MTWKENTRKIALENPLRGNALVLGFRWKVMMADEYNLNRRASTGKDHAMEVQQIGSAKVVRIMGQVDSITCQEVESTLKALIATNPANVICDSTATRYISSAGLRAFLLAAKDMKKVGGKLALVSPRSNYVYEVLELAGITHIIPVFETVDEAMAQLS